MKLMNEKFFSLSRSLIYFIAWRAIFMLENKIVYVLKRRKKLKRHKYVNKREFLDFSLTLRASMADRV